MTFEILLVSGCILAMLSIVSIVSALIDGHTPRVAAVVAVTSGGLILAAAAMAEDGLQFADVPNAFAVIVAAFLN